MGAAAYQRMAEEQSNSDPKLIIVGDGAIGKTCLIQRFLAKGYVEDYTPTMFNDLPLTIAFDDEITGEWQRFENADGSPNAPEEDKRTFNLWDTAGQESFETLRELTYPKTHVIVMGYEVSSQTSLENARTKWKDELDTRANQCEITKTAPRVLVGTMVDKRHDASAAGKSIEQFVSPAAAYAMAKEMGCVAWIETSAKADINCNECLDLLVKVGFTCYEKAPLPFKIEDFDPSAQAAAPSAKEARTPAGAGNTTSTQSTTSEKSTSKEAPKDLKSSKTPNKASDNGCCVVC